tara:strand:- start:138 stop:296 length:159 start_codon:yes stop_codon:yes gene_type:complete
MSRGGLAKGNRVDDSLMRGGTKNLMGERNGFDNFARTLEDLDKQSFNVREDN